MKRSHKWLTGLLLLYITGGCILFFFQHKMLFQPQPLNASFQYPFKQSFKEVNILMDSGINLHLVQFNAPDSNKKGVVLYFHGNRENIIRYAPFADRFIQNGYAVWMPEYPGFGKSTGQLSESLLYEEALQVYQLARKQYSPDQIIIYGKSLGTGIASQLATIRDCRRLILETPYSSMAKLVTSFAWMYPVNWLLKYKFLNEAHFPKITAPITIFHGTNDGTIPYQQALALKKYFKPSDEFITINGGKHNNLNTFPLMHQKLDSLLR